MPFISSPRQAALKIVSSCPAEMHLRDVPRSPFRSHPAKNQSSAFSCNNTARHQRACLPTAGAHEGLTGLKHSDDDGQTAAGMEWLGSYVT
eukprot:scaffold26763_cov44-Prasinocladus_malaysianus.AAC.1